MTQDYSNPLVYWSVMGQMMTHFEVVVHFLIKVPFFISRTRAKDIYSVDADKRGRRQQDGGREVEAYEHHSGRDHHHHPVPLGQCLGWFIFSFLLFSLQKKHHFLEF